MWELQHFDLERLRADLAIAIADWDWNRGCFGHSLPLTTGQLSDFGSSHYNNLIKGTDGTSRVQAPDTLDDCPYFRSIFDWFQCDKSSFRILRRPPHSSYTVHKDDDIGANTIRVQVPIETNPDVRLLVSTTNQREDFVVPGADYRKVEYWEQQGLTTNEIQSWLDEFVNTNTKLVRIYQLDAGKLYYFDTPLNYHNLWNFGDSTRYTLAIDLIANDWLRARYPDIFPVR